MLNKLFRDESGVIISAELALVLTIAVLAMVVGLSEVAVAVNTDGVREVLGMALNPSEAEIFWSDFLRSLTRRGRRGVELVIPDAHEGLKAAAAKVLGSTW